MKRTTQKFTAMVLALTLAAAPLAACSGQSDQAEATQATAEQTTAAASVDVASWKTLGDAFKAQATSDSYAYNESTYMVVFQVGDSLIRVVAKMDADVYKQIDALDWADEDHDQKLQEAISPLEIVSAEDITSGRLSQEDLDAYVGKTGKELVDAGFTFSSYYMYGGESTGATMDNGYFSYGVEFAVSVPEEQTEDGGAAIQNATIASIEYMAIADSALNLD